MDPKQRLVQIEQEKRQWQKYYEDEERRIEEEYVRREAEIDEELKEGLRKIRLEFFERREALKRQYSGDSSCEKACNKSSMQYVCTNDQ